MLRGLIIALMLLLAAGQAAAHRAGVPVTTVDWNPRLGAWEIVHRVSVHDLDAALPGLGARAEDFTAEATLTRLGDYAADAFQVRGRDVALSYVGAELDGDQVYIYFEMRAPDQIVRLKSELLFGAGETQFAHVNVRGPDGVQSYVFDATSDAEGVELKRP